MRRRLARSPWWVQGLLYGTLFGAVMTVLFGLRSDDWSRALLTGFGAGAIYGVAMGVVMSRVSRPSVAVEGYSADEIEAAAWPSSRGPLPTEPRQRAAARALLQQRRDNLARTRSWSLVVFGAGLVVSVVLALAQSWLWWFFAAVFLGFLVMTLALPRRMDRRLELFDTEP